MDSAPNDLRIRREQLVTSPAPEPRHDAIVILRGKYGDADLRLRYVPDRDILSPENFSNYLKALTDMEFESLEATALTILEDVNDQVIPNWLEVTLRQDNGESGHEIRIEDRQPKWDDRGLLQRLEP